MDGWMDGWTDRQSARPPATQTDRKIDGQMDRYMYVHILKSVHVDFAAVSVLFTRFCPQTWQVEFRPSMLQGLSSLYWRRVTYTVHFPFADVHLFTIGKDCAPQVCIKTPRKDCKLGRLKRQLPAGLLQVLHGGVVQSILVTGERYIFLSHFFALRIR